jgi:hypothetical protein
MDLTTTRGVMAFLKAAPSLLLSHAVSLLDSGPFCLLVEISVQQIMSSNLSVVKMALCVGQLPRITFQIFIPDAKIDKLHQLLELTTPPTSLNGLSGWMGLLRPTGGHEATRSGGATDTTGDTMRPSSTQREVSSLDRCVAMG